MNETPAAQTEEQLSAGQQIKNFFFEAMDLLEVGLLTFFVFMLIFAYVFKPVSVSGSSMVPTLRDDDSLIMFTLTKHPTPGRIVVIDDQKSAIFADETQTDLKIKNGYGSILVKRVIAVGGQELNIDFETGAVAVDGKQLEEPYIADLTKRNDGAFQYPFTIPEGYIFVMGDNRLHSTDSRSSAVALIPEDEVIGTVVMRYNRVDTAIEKWTDRYDFLLW